MAALAVALVVGTAAAECPPADESASRTLILAMDGVPYRAMRAAREMGAFAGWGPTRPLVSTFPSMTNVGFSAILEPFGAQRIPGYEIRYYDPESNRVTGGGVSSAKFEWRRHFQIELRGLWAKSGLYMTPRTSARKELRHIERWALEAPDDVMLALLSSTDALTHLCGDDALVRVLVEFSERLDELRRRHRETRGRPLEVVLLSDHGNTGPKVRRPEGLARTLRRAGLRPAGHLQRPGDVIAPTYGIVGYGALYLEPHHAETAARAILEHEGVFLAAWKRDEHVVTLVTRDGEGRIEWRDGPPGRFLAYRPVDGDPLGLGSTMARMRQAGVLDAQGYASRSDWFDWTALERYPDAVARLVDSLDGVWVGNAATVIFSFEPGYAWGLKPAEVAAWIRAGRLEETHGGLDRQSSWGFFTASDPARDSPPAVRAERALAAWAPADPCTTASLMEFSSPDLHGRP